MMQNSIAELIFSDMPFATGQSFDTDDLTEARHFYGSVFSPHRLRLVGRDRPLRASLSHLPMGALSLIRHSWQAQVEVDRGWIDGYYLLCLPLKGKCDYENDQGMLSAHPGQFAMVGGQHRLNFTTSADFEQIAIRIDLSAVVAGWSSLVGEPPKAPVCFQSEILSRGPAWEAIVPVLKLIAQCTKGGFDAIPNPRLLAHLEGMLVSSLLLNQPHSFLAKSGRDITPSPVYFRRAKEYMQEHLDEPLNLMTVADAVGVPGRTLQWAFQSSAGMGPMQWLKMQRLEAVRTALMTSTAPAPRIADIVMRFGFTHLGEFSRQYRSTFGEAPRDTLMKRG